jgi:hypothetical protein
MVETFAEVVRLNLNSRIHELWKNSRVLTEAQRHGGEEKSFNIQGLFQLLAQTLFLISRFVPLPRNP